jgi:hypothetical protein
VCGVKATDCFAPFKLSSKAVLMHVMEDGRCALITCDDEVDKAS